ncbi:hypothetical protein HBN54_004211 [Hymenobacter sp. 1B]|uniref:DUF4190 domain-containing protein n=1 Tax=Hymenobacter artigasi TaxID=2719616 RepID=A0ABX1HMW1_9BACT|nr:hypothetical protein [Hymenobacter artigasi]NKI91591.1 hypothetical protein [Hymenobacter artigasi]
MLEFLLFCLLLLLIALVVIGTWLVPYVLLPGVVLRQFFRSERVPQGLKEVVGWTLSVLTLLLLGGYGWSQHLQQKARSLTRQQAAQVAHMPPIRLTVQQPGLLPYPLGRGRIEAYRQGPTPLLVVSGDLPDGQRLRARFTATRGVGTSFETDTVAVSTDEGTPTQAVGHSIYTPATQTVQGEFRCVLSSSKRLLISFPATPVAVP